MKSKTPKTFVITPQHKLYPWLFRLPNFIAMVMALGFVSLCTFISYYLESGGIHRIIFLGILWLMWIIGVVGNLLITFSILRGPEEEKPIITIKIGRGANSTKKH